MAGEPLQQPKRRKGFYEGALLDWRVAALRNELTDREQVTCAAQFLGLAVAAMELSVEHQVEILEAASKIANTACMSRTAVKQGAAWPIQTNIRGSGIRT